jgi:hypothetical protein
MLTYYPLHVIGERLCLEICLEKAAKFEYEFEFYSKGNNRRAIFRNKVNCEDDDVEEIYESGDCLILDLSVLEYFVTEKKELYYNFRTDRVC